MTRLICSILAAGSAAMSMASPASAHEVADVHQTAPFMQRGYYDRRPDGDRFRRAEYEREQWRELQARRERFYSVWHPRWERARFERWYARRCDELRSHRY